MSNNYNNINELTHSHSIMYFQPHFMTVNQNIEERMIKEPQNANTTTKDGGRNFGKFCIRGRGGGVIV